MSALLWTLVVLGITTAVSTAYYALKGTVPVRTAGGMAWNAAAMLALAMWAFWLLVRA